MQPAPHTTPTAPGAPASGSVTPPAKPPTPLRPEGSGPAVDPFHPLLRVIERYRHDVHQLDAPVSEDALGMARAVVGTALPASLVAFLRRWDGAVLFRGALRIRAARDLAPASEQHPQITLFADGPGQDDRWAFATQTDGTTRFGRWHPTREGFSTGAFEPMHERFDRWLMATVRTLDQNLHVPHQQLDARLDADPDAAWLLLEQARHKMSDGKHDAAITLLHRATAADPGLVPAWSMLAEALEPVDAHMARTAGVKALRAIRLPNPWPATGRVGTELLHCLSRLMSSSAPALERELRGFFTHGVTDATDGHDAHFIESVAVTLALTQLATGDRRAAHASLLEQLERNRGFQHRSDNVETRLLLARVEGELGHHDDAERRLRPLRQLDARTRGRVHLELGRIAVQRQEPWAEEILAEALEGLRPQPGQPEHRAERIDALLVLGERHRLKDRPEQVERCLDAAETLARGLNAPQLMARISLLRGDLHHQRGDGAAAEQAWRTAREHAAALPELLQRVLLRRGDLFYMTGQHSDAADDYARAADGFQALGLPLREAWTRLRLAQLGAPNAVEQARTLFKAADLAAGVSAADEISQEPARSVEWHLERAAEHARDRANAQRARPPLTRADAERPERRLGAHRAAIAACDVSVVHTLAAWLSASGRSLDASTPRVTDPNLSRYLAAADLLAAHRSYEASEVLLRQLLEVRPAGAAGRALVGAMARSPNAALVSGLLDALEGGFDPNGMALAAEVLGWRREREAIPTLLNLVDEQTAPTARKAAVVALGRIGAMEALPVLYEALEKPELREETSIALLLLGEWRGLDAQAQALASGGTRLTRTQGEIVGRYGGPAYLLLLVRTADAEGAAGIGALQGLGYLGAAKAVPHLLDALVARDPNRSAIASHALEMITGHTENTEESLLRSRWVDWWEEEGHRFEPGLRYRHGRLLDPGEMIQRLANDDPDVRRSTYDELVISTGASLPFDADGPYRLQLTHRRAWQDWWDEHRGDFQAGHWYFHGDRIS